MTIILLVVIIWILTMVKKMFWDDMELKGSVKKRLKSKIEGDD